MRREAAAAAVKVNEIELSGVVVEGISTLRTQKQSLKEEVFDAKICIMPIFT